MGQLNLVFAPAGVIDLGMVPAGGSGARFLAINGIEHVCKSRIANNGPWVCFNEFFAARVGTRMGLPIPPFQVVSFAGGLSAPSMWFCSQRIQPGQNPDSLTYTRLCNPDTLGAMAVFDLWLCNSDRSNTNLYVEKKVDGTEKLFLIDHGHTLLTSGDFSVLRSAQFSTAQRTLSGCPDVAAAIRNTNQFAAGLDALNGIAEDEITRWVRESPSEWVPDVSRLDTLVELLLERRAKMNEFLGASLGLFPNLVRSTQ